MNSKVERYILESLAASGFAVIAHDVALELRPDVWASAANAYGDMTEGQKKLMQFLGNLARVVVVEVKFADREDWTRVVTRDETDIETRIRNVVGLEVVAMREYHPSVPRREIPDAALTAGKEDAPPEYFCAARTAWFEERGLIDPKLPKKPAPIPFSKFATKG